MKDEINLLPLSAQRSRIRRIYSGRFARLVNTALVALLLVAIGQLGSLAVLKESIRRATGQSVISEQNTKALEAQVDGHNQLLAEISRQASAQSLWSQQVESVLAAVPAQLFVTDMEGTVFGSKLTIAAVSPSRVAGIVYEQALRALPWVKSVDAPLQNFALSSENEFTFHVFRKDR